MTDLSGLPADALAVLQTAAWLAPEAIPRGLLPLAGGTAAAAALTRAGLLATGPDGAFAVTAQTQQLVREAFGGQGRDSAVRAMREYLGGRGRPGRTARCLALLPHLTAWTRLARAEDDSADAADFLNDMVVVLLENTMGQAAVPLAERAVRAVESHLGAASRPALTIKANLASAYDHAGEHLRGARLLEKVVSARTALVGPDDPSVWADLSNLGAVYMRAEAYDRAAAIVERVIGHRTAVLGPRHRGTLMARNNLAVILMRAGRREEAIAGWEAVLPEFETALGPDDEDTLDVRSALSAARRQPGEAAGSGGLAEVEERIAALSGQQDGLGLPQVAALVERATMLRDQGRPGEAATAFLAVIAEGGAALGTAHPLIVSARYRLAFAHHALGRTDLALAACEEALAEADRSLGRTHRETLMAAVGVMHFLLHLERTQEHQALLEARLADVIEGLGFRHPLVRALAAHRAGIQLGQPNWR